MKILRKNRVWGLIAPAITLATSATAAPCHVYNAHADGAPIIEAADAEIFEIEHTIKSQFPQQDRIITIQLPENYYERPNAKFPVLYVLDGENNLEFTKVSAAFLAKGGQTPQMIIVGIHSGTTRGADYTPNFINDIAPPGAPQGDANRFLEFLDKELFDFVADRYRSGPYRMLSGHSLGGLFTTYAMTKKPNMFNAHFIQSPAFSKAIQAPIVERVVRLFKESPGLQGSYFITLGDELNFEAGFNAMKAALTENAPATFQWNSDRQKGRSHMQTRLVGVYSALEQNFAKDWPLSLAAGSGDIKGHIAKVSAKYGVDGGHYDDNAFSVAVQTLFQTGDLAGATAMAEAFVGQYPESPFAHFLLANAHRGGGKLDKALEQANIAIDLIESSSEPTEGTNQLRAALQQLRTRLSKN